jgi:hypothetical protein
MRRVWRLALGRRRRDVLLAAASYGGGMPGGAVL